MHQFPYITDYVNGVFAREKTQWDFILLRPVLLVLYFIVRFISFPLKFVLHRWPLGFEAYLIDFWMAFGMKYLARADAAELFMRHVQIEPLLYQHILRREGVPLASTGRKLNTIDGDYSVGDIRTVLQNRLTIGHDLLSYEVVDRFDKQAFLDNLDHIRSTRPRDHEEWSKAVLESNRKRSLQLLGPTNIVMLVVMTITVFGDLKTTITALNSFGSDSILLWCVKRIYEGNDAVQTDLDFFMQEVSNRGHYNSSAFFSNPSQYLYYHIVFDEVVYDLLRRVPPVPHQAT
ncbi:hypothetical protein KOR34_18750 [Posidoniimonas corsicana]|uniref:Uncharacterized protein n=1 Tax=Posidoniimonas corsicana TaxID=1938618 RepID=A0A5C5VG58_9BACT|nr:hypothetical protein [Posidoniimonas corsicana]TWT36930.1 hypothetical protein KOR34_18750 [Posidoniimonas corsicana]